MMKSWSNFKVPFVPNEVHISAPDEDIEFNMVPNPLDKPKTIMDQEMLHEEIVGNPLENHLMQENKPPCAKTQGSASAAKCCLTKNNMEWKTDLQVCYVTRIILASPACIICCHLLLLLYSLGKTSRPNNQWFPTLVCWCWNLDEQFAFPSRIADNDTMYIPEAMQ